MIAGFIWILIRISELQGQINDLDLLMKGQSPSFSSPFDADLKTFLNVKAFLGCFLVLIGAMFCAGNPDGWD
jgi:amino acid permease